MKFKDKSGKEVGGKEFMQRWKQGIKEVTPLQQTKVNLFGYVIVIVGILWGLVLTFRIGQYWLFTILIGSLVVSGMQLITTIQRYIILFDVQKQFERGLK